MEFDDPKFHPSFFRRPFLGASIQSWNSRRNGGRWVALGPLALGSYFKASYVSELVVPGWIGDCVVTSWCCQNLSNHIGIFVFSSVLIVGEDAPSGHRCVSASWVAIITGSLLDESGWERDISQGSSVKTSRNPSQLPHQLLPRVMIVSDRTWTEPLSSPCFAGLCLACGYVPTMRYGRLTINWPSTVSKNQWWTHVNHHGGCWLVRQVLYEYVLNHVFFHDDPSLESGRVSKSLLLRSMALHFWHRSDCLPYEYVPHQLAVLIRYWTLLRLVWV